MKYLGWFLLVCVLIDGCTDHFGMEARVLTLENEVTALQSQSDDLAKASKENSNSISENAQSIEMLSQDFRLMIQYWPSAHTRNKKGVIIGGMFMHAPNKRLPDE